MVRVQRTIICVTMDTNRYQYINFYQHLVYLKFISRNLICTCILSTNKCKFLNLIYFFTEITVPTRRSFRNVNELILGHSEHTIPLKDPLEGVNSVAFTTAAQWNGVWCIHILYDFLASKGSDFQNQFKPRSRLTDHLVGNNVKLKPIWAISLDYGNFRLP